MSGEAISLSLGRQVVKAIRTVSGPSSAALHEPEFNGNEWRYLKECLDSTFVSSVGRYVDRFEADLAAYTGAGFAVAVVNGTAALHIALKLGGVEPGDEVLIPALTFVATANAVSYCGAIPHFVEIDARTMGMDAVKLDEYLAGMTTFRNGKRINRTTGNVIRAIVPMHTFGHPSDLNALISIARRFGLVLIEDAAESLGSFFQGRHTGTFGLAGILSFNGNKIITTGGGGAILTNDRELAKRARHLTTTSKVPHRWIYEHNEVGYNYRLPNLNAALGCAQLEQLPRLLKAKRNLFKKYKAAFKNVSGVRLVAEPAHCTSNYWLQTLCLEHSDTIQRDLILRISNDEGLMTRPVWKALHRLPMYENCPRMGLDVAKDVEARHINIPSSAKLGGITK